MKHPLAVVFCTCGDNEFDECSDGSLIRAVGNVTSDFPDEHLYIKHCRLLGKKQGDCLHQITLDRFPRVPIFFYRNDLKKSEKQKI